MRGKCREQARINQTETRKNGINCSVSGVDCETKLGLQEITNDFKPDIKIITFWQSNISPIISYFLFSWFDKELVLCN